MKEFSVVMALIDYVPVILFLLGTITLVRALIRKMKGVAFFLFAGGTALLIVAGFLKATYKLLYALRIGDFLWMSNQFFSNQSLGFLLAGIGLMMFVMAKKNRAYAFLPTMALVGIMIVGLGALDAGLCYMANRMKKRSAMICFIVSVFLCLCMGYLSSRNFDKAFMNWVAQIINIFGEGLYYAGAKILDKAGLRDY